MNQVVKYEMRELTRDWGFRLSAMVSIGVVWWLHMIVQGNWDWVAWVSVSLPSAVPYVNSYMAIWLQSLFTILWAGNCFFYNKSTSSEEAVMVRPFSNEELVWGKILGFLIVQLVLALIWMMVGICVNLLLSEAPFAFYPYVFFYFTLYLPAQLFVLGSTMFVKSVCGNRPVSVLVLLVLFGLLMISGGKFLFGSFSLTAETLPNMFSDVTGFASERVYILQRLFLFFVGIGLMFLSVSRLRRVPNTLDVFRRNFGMGMLGVCLGFVSISFFILSFCLSEIHRDKLREAYTRYRSLPKVFVSAHDIVFQQQGNEYVAQSRMKLLNESDQDIKKIVLYLNPGLKVSSVREAGKELRMERDEQVLCVHRELNRGDSLCVTIDYEGCILPEICYLEIRDLQSMTEFRRNYLFNQGTDYYYLNPMLTILTPECVWYPVSLPPVDTDNPLLTQLYYTDFSLRVVGELERVVLSQGQMFVDGDTVCFKNDYRLPGLTLCMGPYTRMCGKHENVSYELCVLKGHEFLVKDMDKRTAEYLMEEWQNEEYKGRVYPYQKLLVVEAPLHFCAYLRTWRKGTEFVQPELVFRPEREAITFNLKNPGGPLHIMLFENGFRSVFYGNIFQDRLPGSMPKYKRITSEYSALSIRTMFQAWMYSSRFPGVNLLMDVIQDELWSNQIKINMGNVFTDLRAVQLMQDKSLREIVSDPYFNRIIRLKGLQLLNRLLVDVSVEELREFWEDFFSRNNFTTVRYETFCKDVWQCLGVDLLAETERLYSDKGLSWFEFKDIRVDYVEEEGKQFNLKRVKVWNRGKVDGVLRVCAGNWQDSCYVVKAGESYEIRILGEDLDKPERWELQTVLSQNIPAAMELMTTPEEWDGQLLPAGVFPIDTSEFLSSPNEYIVDDADEGFLLYTSAGNRRKIPEMSNFVQMISRDVVPWETYYSCRAYGSPVQRYLSKTCGTGELCAAWELKVPESGMYEVFVYNNHFEPDKHEPMIFKGGEINPLYGKKREPRLCYTVVYQGGRESVEIETTNVEWGWVSLGVYAFEKGRARVELSDKGAYPYQMIYADAVKWVKR